MTDDDAVFTTHEGLRDGTATRRLIHTIAAGGTSHAASFDAVQAGDARFHTDALRICHGPAAERPGQPVATESGGRVTETRVVDGYAALPVRQGNGLERALEVGSGLFGAPAP